ncbi:serine/threonine-protein kinase [Nocardiopsis lambiniae]|uniref:Serine/threonine-protein kinase n=1 Tax=Nocardiopsis lambiniae TaxID=3075539 RepID=A0ABU2M2P1_9ACTN|nr:serine/threonine-protein kinase [Nocardiopsis sp. DSM 44743]MDT0326909.1 serine/threonine-protein kinase [Nocardiopsis sp. DSM 44743]
MPPHPPTDLAPLQASDPRVIPPFTVHGRLGAGGMGVVYGATGPDGRWAAVKVVRDEYADEPEFRARFAAEVELMLRVRALCVAPVLARDTRSARPWYATAYLPGPTLARRVRVGGALPASQARVVAAGIAEAISAIHDAGVVHRDLKPANVILAPDGPKVLDFGIARAADLTSHTRTGGLIGSPAWMSPERYRGDSGPEADVFAWGAVVAYAATGRSPFGEGGAETLMYRILNEEPDLTGLPGELAGPVRRALEKDPKARPRATELVHAVAGAPETIDDTTIVTGLIRAHWEPGATLTGTDPTAPPAHGAPPSAPAEPPTPSVPAAEPTPSAPRRRRTTPLALALGAGLLTLGLVGGVGLVNALSDGREPLSGDGGAIDDPTMGSDPSIVNARILGGGSTFLGPLIDTWASGHLGRQPGVEVLYERNGSGAGVERFVNGEIDFGSSEHPLTDEQRIAAEDARGCPVVQFPVVTGAVAVVYNMGESLAPALGADDLVSLYQGESTDVRTMFGPVVGSDTTRIVPVRHDDTASTAKVFERYLETGEGWTGTWADHVRVASGDEGVHEIVERTPGAIGFVNASYAARNGLSVAALINDEQQIVPLDEESTRAAVEQMDLSGDDFSLTGGVTGAGYPIMRVNHVFAYECGYDEGVGAAVRDFWTYALGEEGARLVAEQGYTPLPPSVRGEVAERVARIDAR